MFIELTDSKLGQGAVGFVFKGYVFPKTQTRFKQKTFAAVKVKILFQNRSKLLTHGILRCHIRCPKNPLVYWRKQPAWRDSIIQTLLKLLQSQSYHSLHFGPCLLWNGSQVDHWRNSFEMKLGYTDHLFVN